MLELEVPELELYDEERERFLTRPASTLRLEHSLISISKWEAEHKKPFLSRKEKTPEELQDYIECMCLDRNVPEYVFASLDRGQVQRIVDYIDDPRTATWFNDKKGGASREVITSELVYYWMVAYQIPFECEKWHLNRLLTLVRICVAKSSTKKMSKAQTRARNRELNAQRRRSMHTKG